MTFSMTGFAALEQPLDGATLLLELRAVNSRYLDLHFKLDEQVKNLEPVMRELISAALSRGKVECKVHLMQHTQSTAAMRLDTALMQQLNEVGAQAQIYFPDSKPLSVADVLRWPGVVENTAVYPDHLVDSLKALLTEGLQALNASRAREGDKLKALILDRLAQIEILVEKVKPLMPALIQAYQEKLLIKLNEGLKNQESLKSIDQERIAQELVLFAQRIDVDEELSRLTAHVSEVKRILNSTAPAGKRLDFLMQELNREANTLGAKSVSIQTTQVSIELKVLIEQMREQIQNVE